MEECFQTMHSSISQGTLPLQLNHNVGHGILKDDSMGLTSHHLVYYLSHPNPILVTPEGTPNHTSIVAQSINI